MKKISGVAIALGLLFTSLLSEAQDNDTIQYIVTFPNAVHHECMVTMVMHDIQESDINMVMSSTSPGRYADHAFAKNVYNIKAFNLLDEEVEVRRINPSKWTVKPHNGYIRITYTLYGNYADGTYSGIDREFALLNMPASFLWVEELKDNPIKIAFEFSDKRNWKVSTQLHKLTATSFFAPNLYYFLDSPVVLAESYKGSFIIKDQDKEKEISLVISPDQHDDSEARYLEMVEKVVKEQQAVFGELPDYEYDRYTFLCNYGAGYNGDGMEHRNSTIITRPSELQGNELNFIGTVSHEFFHCWNVERLRPKSLEPFDFTKVNMCGELWFAEGFTSYYGDLTLLRSGVYYLNTFLQKMTGRLNYVLNAPGTGKYSPVEMSQKAPFVDASSFVDDTNFENTFTSYYSYGAVLGLALDLDLRSRFADKDLDGFMRYVWNAFGESEDPYTNEDLRFALSNYTEDASYSSDFFNKYIYGTDTPDYNFLLNQAGFELELADSSQTDLLNPYFTYNSEHNGINYLSKSIERGSYYLAGINQNDVILAVNDKTFDSVDSFQKFLFSKVPGDRLKIKYLHHGKVYEKLTVAKRSFDVIIKDLNTDEVSLDHAQQSLRDAWLNSKVN